MCALGQLSLLKCWLVITQSKQPAALVSLFKPGYGKAEADNCCYSVSRHPWFERLTMLIIMLNAAELALSAELNTKEDQGHSPGF